MLGLVSVPTKIVSRKNPYAIVTNVKTLWWAMIFPWMRGVRAVTIGHVILLGKKADGRDLEHELVHVKQYEAKPLIHPVLYYWELLKKGYRNNKYEVEAYRLSGNEYKDKP